MNILFSIVIPTLNEEQYLPNLLSDIEYQISKDYEVIVVDACSTDKTRQKALSFSKKFPLTFLSSKKKHVSYQRNFGATHAAGEYIIFLDADVRLPKDFLTHIKVALQKKHMGVFLPFMLPDDTTQKTKVLISLVNTLIRLSQTYGRPLAPGGNMILQTDIFKKIGGFSEDLFISEDHDLIRRAYVAGYKAKILRSAKVQISMRRSRVEGDMTFISKYVLAFLMYTMLPNTTALKKKMFAYEMGGQAHLLEEIKKKQKSKKTAEYIRQLLQLSTIILALKYFTRV